MAMPRTLASCSTSPPYCTEIASLAEPAARLGTANSSVSVFLPQDGRYRCIAPCLWCWDWNSGPQENIASPLINHQVMLPDFCVLRQGLAMLLRVGILSCENNPPASVYLGLQSTHYHAPDRRGVTGILRSFNDKDHIYSF